MTLNLLNTSFPMRGDLAKREPQMLKKWISQNRYNKLREFTAKRKKFILHDGPPFANGSIHLGHAVNKILKDIVIRYKTLSGFDTPYVPGWDCHGLAIELNIEKQYGKDLPPLTFIKKCREHASLQIEEQKKDFIRLGVLGQWDDPYKTMNFGTEAGIIRCIAEIYKSGQLLNNIKPVHWCIDCASAIAEAEIEYQEKESLAIDVAFKAGNPQSVLDAFGLNTEDYLNYEIFAVIWTTTPWTLPANQAICAGADIKYALIKTRNKLLIIAEQLVDTAWKRYSELNQDEPAILQTVTGKELEFLNFEHPFYRQEVPLILGEHATDDTGTGLIHIAPAHGLEDFLTGSHYQLKAYNPVDGNGNYLPDTKFLENINIRNANEQILKLLNQNDCLLNAEAILHNYPCCWRHHSKIIFRTTKQWFIAMDRVTESLSLRERALKEIDNIGFFPAWGRTRLEAMIKNRPDWCISRQRLWGVPLTLFLHKKTGAPHPNSYELFQYIAELVEQKGSEAWLSFDSRQLKHIDLADYTKSVDTLDVWLNSGTTHTTVLNQLNNLSYPADLYLEGSDQHRGWFQSSLLTSCLVNNSAPYKQVLTHGFVVDGNGHKMSKSKGNVIAPKEIINRYGADVLRLWVATSDYSGDLFISEEILSRVTDSYRRIRNTIRFLLANLADFDSTHNIISIDQLLEIDKYALAHLKKLQNKVRELYDDYQFHLIVQELVTYCSDELGGFYLDIIKNRLYTCQANSLPRRSAQTTLWQISKSILLMLSPILAFTSEEAWEILINDENDSTLFHLYDDFSLNSSEIKLLEKWKDIRNFKTIITKELEAKRLQGIIGSSLQAQLIISAEPGLYKTLFSLGNELKFIYMVSNIQLFETISNSVEAINLDLPKCSRCWHYDISVGSNLKHPEICSRCHQNIKLSGEERYYV